MDKASQPILLAHSLSQQALNNQLGFLRDALMATLDALESIRACYLPQSNLQLDEAVQRFEENLLRTALARSHGNQTHAARLLGVKVTTFHAKLKRHKIHHDESVIDRSLVLEERTSKS